MVEAEQTSDLVSTETGTSAQPLTPDGLSWVEVQVGEEKEYKIHHVDVALSSPKGSKGTSVLELLKIGQDKLLGNSWSETLPPWPRGLLFASDEGRPSPSCSAVTPG